MGGFAVMYNFSVCLLCAWRKKRICLICVVFFRRIITYDISATFLRSLSLLVIMLLRFFCRSFFFKFSCSCYCFGLDWIKRVIVSSYTHAKFWIWLCAAMNEDRIVSLIKSYHTWRFGLSLYVAYYRLTIGSHTYTHNCKDHIAHANANTHTHTACNVK